MTRCTDLTDGDRCRIYLSRPKICQEYATSECGYDDRMLGKVLETPEQIWEDAGAVLPPRLNPRRRGAAALPVIVMNGVEQEVQ
jgi:hypothetical protein